MSHILPVYSTGLSLRVYVHLHFHLRLLALRRVFPDPDLQMPAAR